MPTYRFKQVDVFTSQRLYGNPVAVVLDADGIEVSEMQRIAAWTNLLETTFILTPTTEDASHRVRIFSPGNELPFAGHPTIGSAHAVLEAGVVSARDALFVQECRAGLLPLRDENGVARIIWARAPEPRIVGEFPPSLHRISQALRTEISGDPPQLIIANGPIFLMVKLPDSDALSRLQPDPGAVTDLSREFSVSGICAFAILAGDGPRIHLRWFAPAFGVPEDPITGSANATLPAFLAGSACSSEPGESTSPCKGWSSAETAAFTSGCSIMRAQKWSSAGRRLR